MTIAELAFIPESIPDTPPNPSDYVSPDVNNNLSSDKAIALIAFLKSISSEIKVGRCVALPVSPSGPGTLLGMPLELMPSLTNKAVNYQVEITAFGGTLQEHNCGLLYRTVVTSKTGPTQAISQLISDLAGQTADGKPIIPDYATALDKVEFINAAKIAAVDHAILALKVA